MPKLSTHFSLFVGFLRSANFTKALLLLTAAVIPIVIAVQNQNLSVGIAMAVGVLLSSPSDVPGSFKRRIIGISASIVIAVFATLITSYSSKNSYLFIPVFSLLVFGFSLISVYGFRASLISFSGIFAVVLSMANVTTENSILLHSFLIGCGGLGYLLLVVVLNYFRQNRQTEELLAEGFELTANYLKIRGQLFDAPQAQWKKLNNSLFKLQSEINEKHEIIRELVISKRLITGKSGEARKNLLLFIEQVDILEIGMSNPMNYEEMNRVFKAHKNELELLKEWNLLMSNQLKAIAHVLENNLEYESSENLEAYFVSVKDSFSKFSENEEALTAFISLFHFKEKQYQKIISIGRILKDKDDGKIKIKSKEALKFLTHQEYSFKKLQNNLDLNSPIFRHSLRLIVVLLAGFFVGEFFKLQNPYWILLTSLVIMRPGYALTRERFKQRLYGTLIGGAIAISIIFLIQNLVVYAILAMLTFVLAFSMIQRNYKTAAAFITLNVVFIYSLLTPNAYEVIQFRLLDTLIGAGLAFMGNSFLWPTWEYKEIKNFIAESIQKNQGYLSEINAFYEDKKSLPTSYKLARKQAFLANGNLSAAFQRITQEPKFRVNIGLIYQIVTLIQELSSAIASLGTFIRTHQTTPASTYFKNYIDLIQTNLQHVVLILQRKPIPDSINPDEKERVEAYFKNKMEELKNTEKEVSEKEKAGILSKIREGNLIFDQLKWLMDISLDLKKMALNYTAEKEYAPEN